MRTWGRRIQSGTLGSFGGALGAFGFIRVHSCAPWVSSGSFGFIWFIAARLVVRRVHLRSLSSLVCALVVDGFIRGCPTGRRLHSGSFSSFGSVQGVVGFIRIVRLIWQRSGCCRFIRDH